ncbi:30S ribosomal protein S27ae [Candidatus Bathyarchaeota archaeon]|nr:MAG: 30S ribosomal protein S27ae [Candidatus Bathyarchaeota archaeon]
MSQPPAQAKPPAPEKGKSQAPAPAKPKQKKRRMRSELYEISGSATKLRNRKCPRCGSVMASHKQPTERWVCGACSFTDYAPK